MKKLKIYTEHELFHALSEIDLADERIYNYGEIRKKAVNKINDFLEKLENEKILDCEYNKVTKEIRYKTKSCIDKEEFVFSSKSKRKFKKH